MSLVTSAQENHCAQSSLNFSKSSLMNRHAILFCTIHSVLRGSGYGFWELCGVLESASPRGAGRRARAASRRSRLANRQTPEILPNALHASKMLHTPQYTLKNAQNFPKRPKRSQTPYQRPRGVGRRAREASRRSRRASSSSRCSRKRPSRGSAVRARRYQHDVLVVQKRILGLLTVFSTSAMWELSSTRRGRRGPSGTEGRRRQEARRHALRPGLPAADPDREPGVGPAPHPHSI